MGRLGSIDEHGDADLVTRSVEPAPWVPSDEPPTIAHGRPLHSIEGSSEGLGLPRAHDGPLGFAAVPLQLGRYVMLGTLGRGGMGLVLEAFDRTLDRRVAVKVLSGELDEVSARRLLREAQALAKLSHPNVVQVYEAGEADGQLYIAMELVRGQTLREWMMQSPRPGWRRCVEVFLQAGAGLAAAHERGLVHRDFKPGNAIVDEEGRARVLDFGLTRMVGDEDAIDAASVEPATGDADQGLTQTGTVVGTPAYMPLEQMLGREVDARSDQFSFCVSLYEAVYGERPFEGGSMAALMIAITRGQLRPAPKGTDVPARLRQALLRGLHVEPEQRWPSMAALLGELRRLVAPRSRRWWALGLAAGLATIGLGLYRYAEVGFRCQGAEAQLRGVWDDARRQELEAAILGTGLSYAADTWERVEPRLDGYAREWIAKHVEACEATSVRQEQSAQVMDLRMACLSGRRRDLRAAVDVLTAVDVSGVEKAVHLVAGLPQLSRCDDVEALQADIVPPDDPEVAAAVEAEREQLAESRARRLTGDYGGAESSAAAVVERAGALGYPPLVAEALLERGSARHDLGAHANAEEDLEQAFLLALEHDHEPVQVSAASTLVYVVGFDQARLERGEEWGAIAQALARRPTTSAVARAGVYSGIGNMLALQGKPQQAALHHERALALLVEALGPRDPSVARSLANIGTALEDQGKPKQALEHHERALDIAREVLGPGHPEVAAWMANIANVILVERPAEALALYARALAIFEQTQGPEHPRVAATLQNMGFVLLHYEHQPDQARERFERALAIFEAALGPRHPSVANCLVNLGEAHRASGAHDEAKPLFERALAIMELALAPDHPHVSHPLMGLALVALAQQRPKDAVVLARRAVALLEAHGQDLPALAEARFILARALWDAPSDVGDQAGAVALAEQARDGFAAAAGSSEQLAEVQAWLAEHRAPSRLVPLSAAPSSPGSRP